MYFYLEILSKINVVLFCLILQPFGVPPKSSSTSLTIAKSIAAGFTQEISDNVAASSPLAALSMKQEIKITGKTSNNNVNLGTGLCNKRQVKSVFLDWSQSRRNCLISPGENPSNIRLHRQKKKSNYVSQSCLYPWKNSWNVFFFF